jgi:phage terminase small subunit
MSKKLTSKQEVFCQEYLVDLNATQSAIRAGYSIRTAQRIGSENLSKPLIQERIERLKLERSNSVGLNAKYVLNRLVEIDKLDVIDILDDSGNMKAIRDWPKSWRTSISGLDIQDMLQADTASVIQKIKWPDKSRNLELLGRHVDIKAWDGEQTKDNSPIQKVQIEVINAS